MVKLKHIDHTEHIDHMFHMDHMDHIVTMDQAQLAASIGTGGNKYLI
jgi:hypothetical protein